MATAAKSLPVTERDRGWKRQEAQAPSRVPQAQRCCNESVSLAHPGTQRWGGSEWDPCPKAACAPKLAGGGQASR